MHDGLSGFLSEKLDLARTDTSEKSSNVTFDRAPSTLAAVDATSPSSLEHRPTLETTRRPRVCLRCGIYTADTVEREFSKQLEMEISKSALKDSSILDDGIFDASPKKSLERGTDENRGIESRETDASSHAESRFESSRYDIQKMLGYSRTEEDLPILDLENQVLERTLKDYNAYMTSRFKPVPSLSPIRRTSGLHPARKPIINSEESEEAPEDGSAEVTSVTKATQDDGTSGDLSCINGTFLPAPLSRHALIKYVK